jgi:DNA-directed RNA polymerase specialized sigma24 family protein
MDDDVTQWLTQLAEGDELAAQRIWERYHERLLHLARKKLRRSRRRAADEEDAVLSAFHGFCRGAASGRFPQLADRDDLWKVLMTLTARKAASHLRRELAAKRGGGKVRGNSVFKKDDSTTGTGGIDQVLGEAPTPEFAVLVTEECEHRLDELGDESLRRIALLKLEGCGNQEIAEELGCGLRTVERKLKRIRARWEREDDV